jgi:hypothetical protein
VTRSWRKLHNEDLHNVHSSPRIIRKIIKANEMDKEFSTNWYERNACRILVRKCKGKRPLGIPEHR